MKRIVLTTLAVALMAACSTARADVYSLTPSDADLGDLDHYKYYTWGMDTPWETATEEALSATLTFTQIRNWQNEHNVLYVHLLDWAPEGVRTNTDYEGGGDYFDGQGTVLAIYRDLPTTPQDLVWEFTDDQMAALNDYAADGRFALGFDPDCHFYNDGVQLDIVTELSEIPEPATLGLVSLGAVGVLLRRRRQCGR